MSASLYLLPKPRASNSLEDKLRYIFARKFLDSDGSMSGEFSLDKSHIDYLMGIYDSTDDKFMRKGLTAIMDAIHADGEARLEIRH